MYINLVSLVSFMRLIVLISILCYSIYLGFAHGSVRLMFAQIYGLVFTPIYWAHDRKLTNDFASTGLVSFVIIYICVSIIVFNGWCFMLIPLKHVYFSARNACGVLLKTYTYFYSVLRKTSSLNANVSSN